MEDNQINGRVTKLEEVSAHQQQLLQELNDVIIDLRAQVDQLATRCHQLASRIEAMEHFASIVDDRPEKPPHY